MRGERTRLTAEERAEVVVIFKVEGTALPDLPTQPGINVKIIVGGLVVLVQLVQELGLERYAEADAPSMVIRVALDGVEVVGDGDACDRLGQLAAAGRGMLGDLRGGRWICSLHT